MEMKKDFTRNSGGCERRRGEEGVEEDEEGAEKKTG